VRLTLIVRAALLAPAALIWIIATSTATLGADPTSAATASARPPTCAERFPGDGPAGVDLQLGCVVNEIATTYLGAGRSGGTHRLTGYLVPIAVVAFGSLGLWLVARAARRRAGRRLAPATPSSWWSCPACHSLNGQGGVRCYRCGRPFEPGAAEVRTTTEPPAQQSFGQRRDGG